MARGWCWREVAGQLRAHGHEVAYGQLWTDDDEDEVELARLIVAPAQRGRGVGSRLVAGPADRALQLHSLVTLRVLPDNVAARRCYAAAGFERVGAAEEDAWNRGQPADYVWMVHRGPGLTYNQSVVCLKA